MKYTVKDRFLKYVKIDTEADPNSETYPTSEKQKNLTKILMEELKEMGIDSTTNDAGYVYAHIDSNVDYDCDTVFFCAHIDTAPDCSGTNVKPIVHENYQGEPIVLPDDESQIIDTKKYPDLANKIGHDVITASGTTLLGSDDKSGLAAIMDAVYQLVNDKSIPHGKVSILFTTDEEVGKGTDNVDISMIDADYGYTLDSGDLGYFEYENFSADGAELTISGVAAHPGYAKGKMEHAIKIASEIVAMLPKDTLTPETTDDMQGFIHPTKINGVLGEATVGFIIRDFNTAKLKDHAKVIEDTAKSVLKAYPGSSYKLVIKEQYRNMREVLDKHPQVIDNAIKAMERLEIPVTVTAIRGGTDGAVLSHKGLPCPNLFAGMQAIHSVHEWTTVQDMEAAVDTVIEICKVVSEKVS